MNKAEQLRKDTMKCLQAAEESLFKILQPISFTKIKHKEACEFIEQGKFMRAKAQIKVIVECHKHLLIY